MKLCKANYEETKSVMIESINRFLNYINEYWSRNCITEKGSTDCSGALEMTLHRILEAGGTENDVYRIMGAKIPTDEELKDLEEFDEFVWIDLGYVLPGLIDMWEEK